MTIESTKNRCKEYGDVNLFSDDKLIMTIDSFCYKLIEKIELDKEACDVNVLTAKLHSMINSNTEIQV